ncbi:MAG: orotate phosphoribosyltransferase [Verrucomicrobiota bacterium]
MAEVDSLAIKGELLALLCKKSVFQGNFTLASGAQSDLYIDARLTTLDPRGAQLIGALGWQLIKERRGQTGSAVNAIGGLTLGADPVALGIGIAARADDPANQLQVFTVRKTAKTHGRNKLIEGNFREGDTVVIVDDVITSGGSALQAVAAVEQAGGHVAFILVLVDREEGGREKIEAAGHQVISIFGRSDLIAREVAQARAEAMP